MSHASVLIFLVVMVFMMLVLAVICYQIWHQAKSMNEALQDIAQSQRILANNPKNFEETKRINALKKNPYD
jgi:predicted PurR-regulated permease PerM